MSVRTLAMFAALAVTLVANRAAAQIIPLGERTAQMGGAAIAAGHDSAMPYLNPAGLAAVPDSLVSLSASIYGINRFRLDPFFLNSYDTEAIVTENRQSGSSVLQVPSSIMYVFNLGERGSRRHKLALSLSIPYAGRYTIQGSYRATLPAIIGADSDDRGFTATTTEYNAGASYATALSDRLRLGVTVFARYHEETLASVSTRNYYGSNGALQLNEARSSVGSTKALSAWARLGAQAQIIEHGWVGVSLATPSVLHSGSVEVTESVRSDILGTASSREVAISGNVTRRSPLRVGAGLAYEVPGSFSVALDGTYTAALDEASTADLRARINQRAEGEIVRGAVRAATSTASTNAVFDVALGGELWLSPTLAWRAGMFTAFSPIELDVDNDGEYTATGDIFGFSTGIGLMLGLVETSLGLSYQYSAARILVPDSRTDAASLLAETDFNTHTLLVLIGGSIAIPGAPTEPASEE